MIKRLATYIGQYKKYAVRCPVVMVLEVLCELALPLMMAKIIDVGIATHDIGYILRMGGLMVALAAVAMVCGAYGAKLAAWGSQGFGANLRQALFHQIGGFSFGDIDRFSSASLVTRMTNDVNNLQRMLAMGLRMMVRAPVMMIAALIITVRINAKLSLVLLFTIPVLAVSVGLLMKVCSRLFRVMQQKIDALNEDVQENLVAIRVVKAFVREGYERTKFKKANDELTQAGLNAVMRVIFMQPIMILCFTGATVCVLWFGSGMVLGGSMNVGQLYSFLTYISQILMSVIMMAMALLQLTRAQASATRIIEVLDTHSNIRDGDGGESLPTPQGRVEFQNVSFRYQAEGSGDEVLSGLSFTAEPGQFVAIVGGTGTGKSSLVNLIPRFYDVDGGKVLVDGMDVRDYPLEALRRRIGMVLQNNVLFSGTIRDNLLWGRPELTDAQRAGCAQRGISEEALVEELMIQAAKDAQAYDFIMSFPQGFDTWLEQGGVNVSGGQKQRLCIARAMLRHPAILILDDSTSAVDSATEAAIRVSFKENLAGTTVIIIAQRISSVRKADRIVVLEDGSIADEGTHEELMARSAIYQEIYQSQQEGVSE